MANGMTYEMFSWPGSGSPFEPGPVPLYVSSNTIRKASTALMKTSLPSGVV